MFRPHTFGKKLYVLAVPDVEILVDPLAYDKMWQYVDQAPEEISWMGFVTRDDYTFTVHDVILFRQECNPAHTEALDFGLHDAAETVLAMEGGKDLLKQMRLWGHSHVNMDTDPSGQDEKQTKMFETGGCDWAIRLICNKSGKMSFSLMLYDDGLEIRDAPWRINKDESELEASIKAEIAEKVSFAKDKPKTTMTQEVGKWFGERFDKVKSLKGRTFSTMEQAFIDMENLEQLSSGGFKHKQSGTIVYSTFDVEQWEKDIKDFKNDYEQFFVGDQK